MINSAFFSVSKRYSIFFILFFLSVSIMPIDGQEKALSAKEIFNQYIDACGGKAAFDKIKSRLTTSITENQETKEKTEITYYQAKPVKLYAIYTSASIGKLISGTDGKTVWEISSLNGPKIKQGPEKEVLLRECIMDKYVNWGKIFSKITTDTAANAADKFYNIVTGTIEGGQTQKLFFDKKTHYLTKIDMSFDTGDKKMPVEVFIGDYRKTDAVMLPYRTQVHFANTLKITTISQIINNTKLKKNQFDLPAEIKKLKK